VNWAVLRREWGAVTFVLTVVIGLIVVPVTLYLANLTPAPISTTPITTSSTPRASGVPAPPHSTSPTPQLSATTTT